MHGAALEAARRTGANGTIVKTKELEKPVAPKQQPRQVLTERRNVPASKPSKANSVNKPPTQGLACMDFGIAPAPTKAQKKNQKRREKAKAQQERHQEFMNFMNVA